ncbi:hypothetical protein QJQ45_024072, partial [Haematococcus lacustris]
AVALLEDAMARGFLPSFTLEQDCSVDLRNMPPVLAEVYTLTILTALEKRASKFPRSPSSSSSASSSQSSFPASQGGSGAAVAGTSGSGQADGKGGAPGGVFFSKIQLQVPAFNPDLVLWPSYVPRVRKAAAPEHKPAQDSVPASPVRSPPTGGSTQQPRQGSGEQGGELSSQPGSPMRLATSPAGSPAWPHQAAGVPLPPPPPSMLALQPSGAVPEETSQPLPPPHAKGLQELIRDQSQGQGQEPSQRLGQSQDQGLGQDPSQQQGSEGPGQTQEQPEVLWPVVRRVDPTSTLRRSTLATPGPRPPYSPPFPSFGPGPAPLGPPSDPPQPPRPLPSPSGATPPLPPNTEALSQRLQIPQLPKPVTAAPPLASRLLLTPPPLQSQPELPPAGLLPPSPPPFLPQPPSSAPVPMSRPPAFGDTVLSSSQRQVQEAGAWWGGRSRPRQRLSRQSRWRRLVTSEQPVAKGTTAAAAAAAQFGSSSSSSSSSTVW